MSSPLKQNTVTIQNILAAINALPEAGGSGGSGGSSANLKTCYLSGVTHYPLHYTTVENGQIVYKTMPDGAPDGVTVLCDSIIYYDKYESEMIDDITIDGGFQVLYDQNDGTHIVIKASSIDGAHGTLEFIITDGDE